MELARTEYAPVRHLAGDISYPMRGRPTWRSDPMLAGGGGPLMDLGVYTVNAAGYIVGDPRDEAPVRVSATTYRPEGNPLFPEGIESRCSWHFTYPSGATATGTTAYDLPGQNRYRVLAGGDWFELDPATNYWGNRLFESRRGRRSGVDDIDEINHFAPMMDHFAKCVRENERPTPHGEMGRRDVYLMKRIYQSAAEGRALDV
jgi:glucose-fructose oxidoreductase